jgi:hypothetical protein
MNLEELAGQASKEKKKTKKGSKKDKKTKKNKENLFFAVEEKSETTEDKSPNEDWKDYMIEMLMRDKEALMEDKKALQGIIEKLTDNLLLEQKKVAQLEAERIQLLAKKNEESKLSNMSMSEWWAKKQAETVEEDNEETSEAAHHNKQEETENSIEETNYPKSFTDWLKLRGKM